MYLVLGCTWSGGVPGLGGVPGPEGVPGLGVYLVAGVHLVGGGCVCPRGFAAQGCVPGNEAGGGTPGTPHPVQRILDTRF